MGLGGGGCSLVVKLFACRGAWQDVQAGLGEMLLKCWSVACQVLFIRKLRLGRLLSPTMEAPRRRLTIPGKERTENPEQRPGH